jgi:predicted phosphoribosyltransferase
MTAARFRDRRDAGRQLAKKLKDYADRPDLLVLALPRGAVPVASEVACALRAPLDVLLVRKLGVPGHEELAMGAVAGGDLPGVWVVASGRAQGDSVGSDGVSLRAQPAAIAAD